MGWHYTRLFSNAFHGLNSKISSLPNKKRNIALLASLGCAMYAVNWETVPYTSRRHVVLLSSSTEKRLAEWLFERMKLPRRLETRTSEWWFEKLRLPGLLLARTGEWLVEKLKLPSRLTERRLQKYWGMYEGKILPASHPDDIRVQMIAKDIVGAARRELGRDRHRGSQTAHVDEFNWEVIVVDDPTTCHADLCPTYCYIGGKIVVNTSLLRDSPAQVALSIGHEVAHAVARHHVEFDFLDIVPTMIVFPFLSRMPNVMGLLSLSVIVVCEFFLGRYISRRNEIEADYIGLLLSASAGYDPRVVAKEYERYLATRTPILEGYLSTHPSIEKIAQLFNNPKVMEEALSLYKAALSHSDS